MLKRPTRLLLEQLGLGGEDLFVEELLELIRRGDRGYSSLMRFLDSDQSRHAEIATMMNAAIDKNKGRFLETALKYLNDGNCLNDILVRLPQQFLYEKSAAYLSSGSFEKAVRLSRWLLIDGGVDLSPGSEVYRNEVELIYLNAVISLMERGECETDHRYAKELLISRGDNTEICALRARYHYALGDTANFLTNALKVLVKVPEKARGSLGAQIVKGILDGDISGINVMLPDIDGDTLEILKCHGLDNAKRTIQSQFDTVSRVLSELTRHGDAIHEWNEWFLTDFRIAPTLITGKILDEAEKGHRKSIALTRYLQTFEEPELNEADTYPMWLEIVSFCIEPGDTKVNINLEKNMPSVLCDDRLLKIAVSELLDFLVYDVGRLSEIEINSNIHNHSTCRLSLSAFFHEDDRIDMNKIIQQYHSSIASATIARVVSIHNGQIRLAGPQPGQLEVMIQLPYIGTYRCNDNTIQNGNVTIDSWTTRLSAAVRTYETELFREVNQILSFLVHDMKNAFSFIHSWGESLGAGSQETNRAVVRIRENISRIRDSAKDAEMILSLNREPKLSYEDIAKLVNGVLVSVQAAFDSKSVRLSKHCDSNIARVAVDRARIESLLANLVKNALEATDSGGQVEVTVSKDTPKGLLVISVSDSGQSSEGPRSAGPGYRVKGTGVGLMAARKIAVSHGGSISMIERSNGGIEVDFTMPLSSEEQVLIRELPAYARLSDETRKALTISAHFRAQGDADNELFLLKKAAELELKHILQKGLDIAALNKSVNKLINSVVRKKAVTPGVLKNAADDLLRLLCTDLPSGEIFKDKIPSLLWSISRGTWSIEKSELDDLATVILLTPDGGIKGLVAPILSVIDYNDQLDELRRAVYSFLDHLLVLTDRIDKEGLLGVVDNHSRL